jgi:hypothetical protein
VFLISSLSMAPVLWASSHMRPAPAGSLQSAVLLQFRSPYHRSLQELISGFQAGLAHSENISSHVCVLFWDTNIFSSNIFSCCLPRVWIVRIVPCPPPPLERINARIKKLSLEGLSPRDVDYSPNTRSGAVPHGFALPGSPSCYTK